MTPRTPPAILASRYLVICGCRGEDHTGDSTIVATGAGSYAEAVVKLDMVRRWYKRAPVSIEASDGQVWEDASQGRLL
ncbi:hypothetical protein HQ535_08965 [bacterium]|nr:hypothetical protein [bacterium]